MNDPADWFEAFEAELRRAGYSVETVKEDQFDGYCTTARGEGHTLTLTIALHTVMNFDPAKTAARCLFGYDDRWFVFDWIWLNAPRYGARGVNPKERKGNHG